MRGFGRTNWFRTVAAVALAGVLVGLVGTAAGSSANGEVARAISATGGANLPSFAARAGFEPGLAADVAGARPSTGSLPVDVVFASNSTGSYARSGLLNASRYASEYGPSPTDYARAARYFEAEGLRVTHEWPDRMTLSLEGSASAIDRAFGTTLVSGSYAGREVTVPATAPSLPSDLQSEVAGVVGLSAGLETFSLSLSPVGPSGSGASVPSQGSGNTVYPGVAREYYGLSSFYNLTGSAVYPTDQAIALVLWGQGYSPSDIQTFFEDYYGAGFPAADVVPHPVDGAPAPSDSAPSSADRSDVEEMTLDLEWSGSAAPGATLDAVYAPNGSAPSYSPSTADLTDALEEALSLPNVSVISMSFGVAEAGDQSLRDAWGSLLSEAATRGITVLAASGDFGGALDPACDGGASVEYPSSSPQVLAVGGTDVALTRSVLGTVTGFNETAWNGSGGGYSTQFLAPSWQEVGSAAGPIEANGSDRGVPDVAATAGDNFLYFGGADMQAAGTSFATPFWAGLVAEMDQQYGKALGWIDPQVYHVGASQPSGQVGIGLAAIDGGGNCVATADGGWSAVTGWGSPRAIPLYEDLVGSYVNLSLSVSPSTVAPGGEVSVATQLTNRTTGRPIADTPVRISAVADTSIGPCTGTFSSAAPDTNATGWVEADLSVPFCYLGAHANVSVIVTTDRLYGTNQTTVSVNLLGLYPPLEVLERAPWSYVAYLSIMATAVVVGGWFGRHGPRPPPARSAGTRTAGPGAPPGTPASTAPSPGPPGVPATPPGSASPPSPPPPSAGSPTVPPSPVPPDGPIEARPTPVNFRDRASPVIHRPSGGVATPFESPPATGRTPLRAPASAPAGSPGPSSTGSTPMSSRPAGPTSPAPSVTLRAPSGADSLPPPAKLPPPSHGERKAIRAAPLFGDAPGAPAPAVPGGPSGSTDPAIAASATPSGRRRPPPKNTQNP